jgi:hypothetical protein
MRTLLMASVATTRFTAAAAPTYAQDATTAAPAPAYEEQDDDGFDLGWLGLIGLAGLLGLRRKRDDGVRTTTAPR